MEIFDCVGRNWPARLNKRIVLFKPDFVGISLIASEQKEARKTLEVVRNAAPGVPLIVGGPWASSNPEYSIRDLGADCVVTDEGEITIVELIDAMEKGLAASSVAGTVSLQDGQLVGTPRPFLTCRELEDIPIPSWDLVDRDIYARMPSMACVGQRPYGVIFTSRGCPFNCIYCHRTMGKIFRARSPESVLSEMAEIKNIYGIKDFEIFDDCFNLDRDRMTAILSGIPKHVGPVRLHFSNGLRIDRLEPGDMALFKRAGTVSAYLPIETASPRLQKLSGKNLDIERAVEVVRAAVKEGIYSTGMFMLGFPTETSEETLKTISLAVSLPLHRAIFTLVTPMPGTKLADMCASRLAKNGTKISGEQLSFFDSINISDMPDEELSRIFRSAYRRFYINPLRIIRLLACHPGKMSLPYYGMRATIRMIQVSVNARGLPSKNSMLN